MSNPCSNAFENVIDEKLWGLLSSPQASSHSTFCYPHVVSSSHREDARGNRNKLPVASHPTAPVWPDSCISGSAMRAWPRVCLLVPSSPSSQPSWCPIKELSYMTIALLLYFDFLFFYPPIAMDQQTTTLGSEHYILIHHEMYLKHYQLSEQWRVWAQT